MEEGLQSSGTITLHSGGRGGELGNFNRDSSIPNNVLVFARSKLTGYMELYLCALFKQMYNKVRGRTAHYL